MFRFVAMLLSILACSFTAAIAAGEAPVKPGGPKVEVCFVLDTTGSMSGLIEGAKQKIWSIANEIISTKPRPQIRLGLVGYRDRGDAYVTQVFDLTDDIDAVFKNLQSFKADGGGDGPESVNQALDEAVEKVSWSKNRDVVKILFLVGDAPPHMDYAHDIKYPDICKKAVKRDLIINTVQCGGDGTTTPIWQEIARLSEGSFIQLAQTGGMVAVATPVDEELARLTTEMNGTVIAYGSMAQQSAVESKLEAATSAPTEVAAARASYMGKSSADDGSLMFGGSAISGRGDLVADLAGKEVDWTKVKDAELPEAMQKMTLEQRKAYVQEQQARRVELQKKIAVLSEKRDAFILAERKRLSESAPAADAFDVRVGEVIQEQAKRKR